MLGSGDALLADCERGGAIPAALVQALFTEACGLAPVSFFGGLSIPPVCLVLFLVLVACYWPPVVRDRPQSPCA